MNNIPTVEVFKRHVLALEDSQHMLSRAMILEIYDSLVKWTIDRDARRDTVVREYAFAVATIIRCEARIAELEALLYKEDLE